MKIKHESIAVLLFFFLCGGCAQHKSDKPTALAHNNLNSALWMQGSSEYMANSLQVYNTARINLKGAIEQTAPYRLPPAVVMDIDETVLDNSQYVAKFILETGKYGPETWDQWVALQEAPAIPGAVDFIDYAQTIGVDVIFITNRTCMVRSDSRDLCPQKNDTIENLKKVGITTVKPSQLLLKEERDGWGAEKRSRREIVASKYRILMLFGDDLGDFLPDVKEDISPEERARLTTENSEKWGSVWYILANPTYGSWLDVRDKPKHQYLEGY